MKQMLHLLNDDSSFVDELSERTHEALAEQLFQIITKSDNSGRVIGLEGKWGAGKSTVVRILREKLNADEKSFTFSADAWEHEGDPLRKLFLLSFIDDLKKDNRVDSISKTKLDKIREEVLYKTSESNEDHISLLSPFGKWVSFLTLFVPIGCVILDKTWDDVTIDYGLPIHWPFVIGVILSIAPVWAFIGQFCHYVFFKNKQKNSKRKPFALFDINASRNAHRIVVSESEKDSVAFAELFMDIVDCVSKPIANLVIVIDNLDRISHADSLKIWSTLQTFVRSKDKMDSPKLWIVIPYTEEGVKALWENSNQEGDLGQDGLKSGVNIGKSFLDKTFQLRLEVPDLLIEDWRSFAENKAREVFVDSSEFDTKLIVDVLCWARRISSDAPSPREIKLYLNQVKLLCDIHAAAGVSVVSICFYVTQRVVYGRSRVQIETDLIEGSITTHSLPLHADNVHLVEDLCAILFHVSRKKGIQILLEKRIKSCLAFGREDDLAKLFQTHKEAFVGVLGHILSHTPEEAVFEYALCVQKGLGTLSPQFHDMAMSHWRDWLANHDNQSVGKVQYSHITEFGDVVQTDAKTAETTWDIFSPAFRDDLIGQNLPPDSWITYLNNAKQSYGIETKILYVSGMLPTLKLCGQLNRLEEKQFVSFLKLPPDAEDQIANEIRPNHELDETLPTAFSVLIDADLVSVQKTFKALVMMLSSKGFQEKTYYKMISCFDCLKDKELRKHYVLSFLHLVSIWSVAALAGRGYEKNVLAYLAPKYLGTDSPQKIASMVKTNQNYVANILGRWRLSSISVAEDIYQLTHRCGDFSYLKTLAVSSENVLVGCIVKDAIRDNDLQLAKGDDVFSLFRLLLKFLSEEDRKKLAMLFLEAGDIVVELENIQEGSLALFLPSLLLLVESMTESQIARTRPGIERILSTASQEEWTKTFSSLAMLVNLLRNLKVNESHLTLTSAFCEIFKRWLFTLFDWKDHRSGLGMEGISILFQFLDDDFREDVAVWINQLARRKAFSLSPVEANLVLEFSAHDKWTEDDGEMIGSTIQNVVISKKKDDLLRLVPILHAGWKSFKPSSRFSSTLKEPVETWLQDASGDVKKALQELSAIFNIKP